eukprot:g12768.t1
MAVSKCQVKMQPPKGVPTTRETWRPLWKNHSNPFQFDRQYLQAIELARLRTMEKQQDRRRPIHSECAKRARKGPSSQLFTDSTEENFLCHYGDVVVSERSRFTLLEGLGSGAFGQVVRCSANSGDQVALKILKHKEWTRWSCAEVRGDVWAEDMWSLGCISIELFVGEPVFPHTGDKDDILQGMVQLIGNIPPHMLDQGSKTSEFFERVREHKASGSRRRGARGRFFLFQWASALREALDALRARAKDAPVVYKLRRQSLTRSPPSLLGDWRARRYDLERRRWLGVPRRLRGSRLRGQLLLRRQLEQLKALTGPSPSLAVGFTHTADLFNPEDGNRYHNPLSRSASSPAMATFQRHTNALSNCTAVLTGGRGFEKNCYDQGTQPLRGTHLPGYQGYVPGFSTNNLSLGKCFSPATTALGRFRDGVQGLPRPMPFMHS